jgi:hypothetical protein
LFLLVFVGFFIIQVDFFARDKKKRGCISSPSPLSDLFLINGFPDITVLLYSFRRKSIEKKPEIDFEELHEVMAFTEGVNHDLFDRIFAGLDKLDDEFMVFVENFLIKLIAKDAEMMNHFGYLPFLFVEDKMQDRDISSAAIRCPRNLFSLHSAQYNARLATMILSQCMQ